MVVAKNKFMLGVATLGLAVSAASITARADDAMLREVLQRLDKLERENAKLRAKVDRQESRGSAAQAVPSVEAHKAAIAAAPPSDKPGGKPSDPTIAAAAPPLASNDGWYLHKKDGAPLTFETPGGEIGIYGVIDVSVDASTKGIKNKVGNGGDKPVGNVGWSPDASSNLSRIGIAGFQKLPEFPANFVYQLETQIDVSANAGISESNSAQSNVVRGGLTTRDSFVGLSNKDFGALKVGKTEAPYKKSTDIFNPFNAQIGDYRVIMGNSGGDNRVEFATRLEHSIWWESPDWYGLKLAALFSPGQNRGNDSSILPGGSSDCTGGNNPNSGGAVNQRTGSGGECTDGSFSDAISLSGTYTTGDLLLVAAYERHEKVNRSGDIVGSGIDPALDVASEQAFKAGAMYKFPTKTTVGFLYERLERDVPAVLAFQNERQRDGTWLVVTQELTTKDFVSFGWAHAFATPGDPGVHNTAGGLNPKNEADLLTATYKHNLSSALTWYTAYAATLNDRDAHFDLGAGGHGVTTDDHDAFGASGGIGSTAHGFAGGTLQGVSTGFQYKF